MGRRRDKKEGGKENCKIIKIRKRRITITII